MENDNRQRLVLLVEDDEVVRELVRRGLERADFRVIAVGTAEEGLVVADQYRNQIDVLVMDIMLPDSWGTRLAVDVRTLHPEVGVVYVSGFATEDPVLGAGLTELKPFLQKPFAIQELVDAVRSVLAPGPDGAQ
jgi:two-component system, cell cycle sensor histidine kinase and response regulator CckA